MAGSFAIWMVAVHCDRRRLVRAGLVTAIAGRTLFAAGGLPGTLVNQKIVT